MRRVNELSLEFVNKNFYECEGKVCRKDGKKCSNWIDKNGYYNIKFNKKRYSVHRILWCLYNKKSIPENYFIDHADGNPSNNSILNLRLATNSQNCHNMKISPRNKSGIKGISIKNNNGYVYYYCQIKNHYKLIQKQFPYTSSGLESAKQWLEEQREQLHGEFARSE